ncbi:MAG: MarR family transcriptional regulator [Deltaproteobacteria bacterium]|nr:MarR family transcriptional regulator [Deltaproteobacteria bacterium]
MVHRTGCDPTVASRGDRVTSSDGGDGDGLGQVLGFMRTLWAVDHALRKASKEMKRRVGLTGPQRLAVRVVGQFPQATAGEIARVLHVHPSTLTGVLDRLGRSGLLRRMIDSSDRRRARFELTAKGELADRARAGTVEERVRRALRGVPADDIRVARGVLAHLARELTNG